MKGIRPWHAALLVMPVVGWLLAVALILDARDDGAPATDASPCPGPRAGVGRRLAAAIIDLVPLLVLALLCPPALAWLAGTVYLLFRDAGPRPFGIGKRVLGLRACTTAGALSYTDAFARNLPLLAPYLGILIEGTLVLAGRPRLGDRLAGSAVVPLRGPDRGAIAARTPPGEPSRPESNVAVRPPER